MGEPEGIESAKSTQVSQSGGLSRLMCRESVGMLQNLVCSTYQAIEMLADRRVLDEGHIITSAGVSAGIDMSLHVVSRLYGLEVVRWTARRMEYNWRVTEEL